MEQVINKPTVNDKKNFIKKMITERVTKKQIPISRYPNTRPNLIINVSLIDKK